MCSFAVSADGLCIFVKEKKSLAFVDWHHYKLVAFNFKNVFLFFLFCFSVLIIHSSYFKPLNHHLPHTTATQQMTSFPICPEYKNILGSFSPFQHSGRDDPSLCVRLLVELIPFFSFFLESLFIDYFSLF